MLDLKTVALFGVLGVAALSTLALDTADASVRGSAKVWQAGGQPTAAAPGDVVRVGQPGVTAPRALRQVGVTYTTQAAAARIEGIVIVECVVRTNGTVDAVRVVKSLDPVYGLDEEAVRAARQWRFAPGLKDGVAVPVLITIHFDFSLTRKEGATPFQAPSLFESVPSTKNFRENVMSVVQPPPGWPEMQKDAPGVHARFLYPQNWRVSDDASPGGWFAIQSEDGTCVLLVSQLHSATWPQSTGGGATRTELQQLKAAFQRRLSALRSRARVDANGWMPLARVWMWYEMRVPAGDPSMPRTILPEDQRRFDGARWWHFIVNVGSQEVAADCFVMRRRGASKAQANEQIREAGPLFLTILRRMSITSH